jgi:hypothetical protein
MTVFEKAQQNSKGGCAGFPLCFARYFYFNFLKTGTLRARKLCIGGLSYTVADKITITIAEKYCKRLRLHSVAFQSTFFNLLR